MDKKYQILLGNKRSKLSSNETSNISLGINSDSRMLPVDAITETIDEYEQYLSEKSASNKYRLIVDIKPICSNVLFNVVSEILYNEGGDDCAFFGMNGCPDSSIPNETVRYHEYLNRGTDGESFNRKQLIRDTAYSHKSVGGLTYHCGYDIFNNHTLRANEFVVVNKATTSKCEDFNTISDFLRDGKGNRVNDFKIYSHSDANKNILDVSKIEKHLYQSDTVLSFNRSIIENLIEDNGWVGFINPVSIEVPNYGDVSINKCMNNNKACEHIDMYPDRTLYSFLPKYNKFRGRYESNWDIIVCYAFGCYCDGDIVSEKYGIKCHIDNSYSNDIRVLMKTDVVNNFDEISTVRLTFLNGNDIMAQFDTDLIGLGVDENHEFYIKKSEIESELSLNFTEIRILKIVNGIPCKYYFHKLSPIKQAPYELNKLAFSTSIYSDDVVQLLFANPVDTSSLIDNIGRVVSELYLMVIKRHKGDDIWYSETPIYNDSRIEMNHCFGKVTAGLDLNVDCNDYNIHKIHNISTTNNGTINKSPKHFCESGITADDEWFLGNLIEFNVAMLEETVLEPIYHRFNTAQRETLSDEYSSFDIDNIETDDYDLGEGVSFKIKDSAYLKGYRVNLQPEGYYYKPLYSLKLKEFSDSVQQGYDTRIAFTAKSNGADKTQEIELAKDYGFILMEKVSIYDKATNEKLIGMVTKKDGLKIRITADFSKPISEYKIFKTSYDKPLYAYNIDDGTGRYLYRDFMNDDNIPSDSDLYNSVFANGTHYLHKSLNFYLRRQDPLGEYGLMTENIPQKMALLIVGGEQKDHSKYEYNDDTNTSLSC